MKIHHYSNKIILSLSLVALILTAGFAYAANEVTSTVDGMYKQAVASYDNKDYKTALKRFRELQKEFPDSRHVVRTWEYIAQCENILGDQYAAFEAYQKIWNEHKDFNKLNVINRNQMQIGNYFLKLKRYKIAIEIYQQVLDNAPYSDVAGAAQYSIAQAHIGREDYYAAKGELRKLIKNYPSSQLIDDAAFDLGYVDYLQSAGKEYDQTETTEAIASFRKFIHDFPSSPKVYEAQQYITKLRSRKAASLYRTGEFYENIRAPKAAEISYREVIYQYPDTDYAEQARNRINSLKNSKNAKSNRAKQVTKMMSLQNEKELAANRDVAGRDSLSEQSSVLENERATQEEKERKVQSQYDASKVKPEKSSTLAVEKTAKTDSEIAKRLKELYDDPETRDELRSTMKVVYLDERLRDKEKKSAWKQQRLVDEMSIKAPEETSEPLREVKVYPQKQDEQVELVTATEPAEIRVAQESKQLEKPLADTSEIILDEPSIESLIVTPVSADATIKDIISSDYKPVDEETESPVPEMTEEIEIPAPVEEKSVAEMTEEIEIPSPVEETSVPEMTEEIETLAPIEKESSAPVADKKADTDFTIDSSELKEITEIPEKEDVISEDKPVEEKVVDVPDELKSKAIAESEIKEQERAAHVKQRVEALKKEQQEKDWSVRKLKVDGKVRRAQYTEEQSKKSSTFNTDTLQREYAAVYYLIQSGDAAKQSGISSDAKKFYGKALDGLIEIKRKAPNWESEVVNYRIKYCRQQMRNSE